MDVRRAMALLCLVAGTGGCSDGEGAPAKAALGDKDAAHGKEGKGTPEASGGATKDEPRETEAPGRRGLAGIAQAIVDERLHSVAAHMEQVTKDICACEDLDCVKKLAEKHEEWASTISTDVLKADREHVQKASQKMAECITKIASKEAGG